MVDAHAGHPARWTGTLIHPHTLNWLVYGAGGVDFPLSLPPRNELRRQLDYGKHRLKLVQFPVFQLSLHLWIPIVQNRNSDWRPIFSRRQTLSGCLKLSSNYPCYYALQHFWMEPRFLGNEQMPQIVDTLLGYHLSCSPSLPMGPTTPPPFAWVRLVSNIVLWIPAYAVHIMATDRELLLKGAIANR